MNCTVRDVYQIIDGFAPFETQLDFDNAGLLLGSPDRPVTRIVTALEVCEGVVREAVAAGAQLLVTHHPVFFQPVKRLVETEPEARNVCALIRAGISLIAAHTNFDMAEGGVNDALAAQLGWQVQRRESLLRFGCFEGPRTLESLQMQASDALGWPVIRYGAKEQMLTRWAICSGAGGSEVEAAAQAGAQVLLTGEIRHHQALEAVERGMAVLEAGHFATEICAAGQLCRHLQRRLDALQFTVQVSSCQFRPFV